jgi:glutathione S-transferase
VIRLYRARFSTNSERVAIALAHKGLEAESVWIEYSDRSEVERVSGQGLVPVIDCDGEVVADSPRILELLDERHPDPPLYPAGPARRAEMRVFIDWFNGVWKTWPNGIEGELGKPEPDQAAIDGYARAMAAALDVFDDLLTDRPYLFGDALSVADCIAYPFVKFAAFRDPEDDELFHRILDERQTLSERLANLPGWIERLRALPQV